MVSIQKRYIDCLVFTALLQFSCVNVTQAQPALDHSSVQFIMYDETKATIINARHGFATHIKLEEDEKISEIAGGDSAGWDIVASKGKNDIFLKPKSTAHNSNLVVATNKRNYTFDLKIIQGKSQTPGTWRLAFNYPQPPEFESAILTPEQIDAQKKLKIKLLQAAKTPQKNMQYSMQIMPNSEAIVPSEAWDDGNFTYFRIPQNREIPTVFRVLADKSETMVNTHMEGVDKDILVVHKVAKQFVLRLGSQVIGIWNDAYDEYGGAKNGTVTPGVSRSVQVAE